MKEYVLKFLVENETTLKILAGYIAYAAMEYWFGKTDRVKEGSFPEFVWARVKGLFGGFSGQPKE
jgi:hypothetical protein